MEHLISISKSLFFASLAIMVTTFTYLIWVNPNANYVLEQENLRSEQQRADLESEALKEWKYFPMSDVATEEDGYPIVVLRTGFKVIRSASDRSLVGWKYEVINTSSSTRYTPTVTYTLQDVDGFDIASGTADGRVEPEEYGTISGTLTIDSIDLERLEQSTWTINLSPSWQTSESEIKGDRYSRLASLDRSTFPFWTHEIAENEFITSFSDKWAAVSEALQQEEELNSIEEDIQ